MKRTAVRSKAISRRKFLSNTSAAAALAAISAVAAPRIINRAFAGTAKDAFKGEPMTLVVWAGNYQMVWDEYIVKPFNDLYGTKVSVLGGWDQHVNQILAAPADNPPFDLIEVDEYTTIGCVENKLLLPTDRERIAGMKDVMPYFLESRAKDALPYGVPFGGGSNMMLINRSAGANLDSWNVFWDPKFAKKTTLDAGAWWYTLGVTALAQGLPVDTMFDYPKGTMGLIDHIEQMKVAKWYRDGAEEANILQQESALISMTFGSGAYQFVQQDPETFYVSFPKEGLSGWTNWFVKVRGTHHADLADLFSSYILEKETQNRLIANSYEFGSLDGLTIPEHWSGHYPRNADLSTRISLLTIDGWRKLLPTFDAVNERWKLAVRKTSA
jgi:spermidine/putrescine transport system substrate-binding protein